MGSPLSPGVADWSSALQAFCPLVKLESISPSGIGGFELEFELLLSHQSGFVGVMQGEMRQPFYLFIFKQTTFPPQENPQGLSHLFRPCVVRLEQQNQ